ncbi:MAG TPA: acyl-CoA reductase [Candidatus Baltobacteraceae bacterium]|nr:acyl-CoA reductase [Candidatus Baltobacteraceae bacterium]
MSDLRASRIVDALADAAARWRDADFPARVRATRALTQRTGYSEPVVEYALDRLFGDVTREALRAVIVDELGSLEALDGFVARPGRPDVFFRGAERVVILSSDTTLGVALPPLLFALCAKTNVVVKDRSDRLVAAFVETLSEELPELAACVRVEEWRGDDEEVSRAHLAGADVVVAFGNDASLRAIRAQLAPGARFVPFGHRTSAGYVARETLAAEESAAACARDAARDALLYDGEGCLSLHVLFVERGGALDPARFTELLSDAFDALALEFPSTHTEPDAEFTLYRKGERFRASQAPGATFAGGTTFTIALDPPPSEPPLLFPRTLSVYPVSGPGEALALIERHRLPLEGFAACPAERADVSDVALRSGAARFTRLGRLQAPPIAGNHGARERILPFVQTLYRDR